ncbi:unnamed protein product [Ectocarpus sp. CCAP 1310/34]|nr:unnamed protein product [Ectocarpus sp. CCAP 1310/34]
MRKTGKGQLERATCCFCCSLRAGVGILAANDLLHTGIWTAFYARGYVEKMLQTAIAIVQSLYDMDCKDAPVQTEDCLKRSHEIEQMEFQVELFENLPVIVYVEAVIAMIAGAVGLFAVFKSNALSAKIYLWTWLPRFFVGLVARYTMRAEMKQYGIDNNNEPGVVINELVTAIFLLYYVKVTWSFHQRLKARSGISSSTSGDVEGIRLV